MLFVETYIASYEEIRSSLLSLYPKVRIHKVEETPPSEASGASKCIFSLDMSRAEFDDMLCDMLLFVPFDSNSADGGLLADDNPDYQRQQKCDWLWNLFTKQTMHT